MIYTIQTAQHKFNKQVQSNNNQVKENARWHKWYAWYPVYYENDDMITVCWGCWVWRRAVIKERERWHRRLDKYVAEWYICGWMYTRADV